MMEQINDILIDSTKIIILGIGLPLLIIFFLGFLLALLQAVTQIQDQILSFFPKVLLCLLIVFIGSSPFLRLVADLMKECITLIVQIK